MSGMHDKFSTKHHNPHAHVIHQPGKRLLKKVPLRFVWNKVSGHGRKGVSTSLNLTAFIDFLITIVVFLLMSFSASGEIAVDKNVKLPKAENVDDVVDAPMIAVNGNQVLVDGTLAGSTRAIEELGRMQKVDELFNILKNKRELWKQVEPNRPFPGVAILQVDADIPAIVVKSVFQTAAFAGYPNVSFMVQKLPKSN
ncbi:ExbD/TolR family protein [Chondromyces apiculatus]|uniref:Adventurous gliding motility protein S n=1 Tax=Chondromyces apiculatus DSM 436 TaxID=1192034 RepID=A0A017SUQ0_9BACT|nr:biopolymer transporter ExbD [Chondromyces apiculatus]EYF00713.1 Adventurous gliding motility protein S [Chondromyces apiculatus DSM 436]